MSEASDRNRVPANKRQVDGNHYREVAKDGAEQHWDRMWKLYREAWFVGNITKYTERYRKKNGIRDLEKARHYLDKLIELETASEEGPQKIKAHQVPLEVYLNRNLQSGDEPDDRPSYPGNARKSNGQLMCGCWGRNCEGHTPTSIGESS